MSVSYCYLEPAKRRAEPARSSPRRRRAACCSTGGAAPAWSTSTRAGTIEARAGREVILSAGAIATPQLLELSGIGRPDVLKAHGIDVAHALPAVGENFRDHIAARIVWR